MRRHSLAPLALIAGLVALFGSATAHAQARVKFDTCDGVELHGTWYGKDGKATTVILLHTIGGSSKQDGWDRLAKALNDKGFAVLSFDFRGHGDSTSIQPSFWRQAHNMSVRGGPKAETISYKDYQKGYYPILVNDIAAAKAFLDSRNDIGSGECNSRSIILIGAQEGAVLGTMWLASEWYRYKMVNAFKLDDRPEGKNVSACVWLSMTGSQPELGNWLKLIGKDKHVPMGFLYGATDNTAATFAQKWARDLKGTSMPTKKYTAAEAIPKSNLAGHALLRKDLPTVEKIVDYCTGVTESITAPNHDNIEFEKKAYAWQFGTRPTQAKFPEEKLLRPIPLGNLGVRVP